MTKKQAIELAERGRTTRGEPMGVGSFIEALDDAGAFMSEETAAEIKEAVIQAEDCENGKSWRHVALRLASACRAAGLVKP